MKRFLWLALFGVLLISFKPLFNQVLSFHSFYFHLVVFFVLQTAILFRVDDFATEETRAQMRLVNIGLRMISALSFLIVMSYQLTEHSYLFYIQFILLYLAFMIFEIILALTNLRRN